MKGRNLGKQLEEIVRLKQKAETQTEKLGKEYVLTATKLAKNTITQLDKVLQTLDDKNTQLDSISIADSIYKILVDQDYKQLEKVKDNYDVWSDLNDKFNS